MKVTMYNVGFGEAILYKEEKQKLLVDWGSVTNRMVFLPGYHEIVEELNPDTALMITHFEEDHFNGILEYQFPKDFKFREVILPKYLTEDTPSSPENITGTEAVFTDILRVWAYGMTTNYDKLPMLHQLFLLLPSLVYSVSDIRCVSYGDSVYVDETCLDILWPQEKNQLSYGEYADEVLRIMREKAEADPLTLARLNRFIEEADRYVDIFLKVYAIYISGKAENLSSELEHLKEQYEIMSHASVDLNLTEAENDRINDIHSLRIKSMNECSIVFQSRYNRDILSLGDISAKIVKYLWDHRRLSAQYGMVKIQHHGSKAYWTDDLPAAKWYLISNSGWAYLKWRIYEKYGMNYPDGMLCTNDRAKRCYYYDQANNVRCQTCNVSQSGNELVKAIEVDTVTEEKRVIM